MILDCTAKPTQTHLELSDNPEAAPKGGRMVNLKVCSRYASHDLEVVLDSDAAIRLCDALIEKFKLCYPMAKVIVDKE